MRDEIRDLTGKLERGEIDRVAFDEAVSSLIEDSIGDAAAPDFASEEAHAIRGREISSAARRAREL